MTQNVFISLPKSELQDLIIECVSACLKHQAPEPQEAVKTHELDFITRKEAAQILGVSLPTLNDWTKTGKVQGYRIGTRVRYKQSELENSLIEIKHTGKAR